MVALSIKKKSCNTLYLLSPCLCFFIALKCDLFVYSDDSLTSKRVIMRTDDQLQCKCFVPLQKLNRFGFEVWVLIASVPDLRMLFTSISAQAGLSPQN